MRQEDWVCPVEFPRYEVSNFGRVFSNHGQRRELKLSNNGRDYRLVTLFNGLGSRQFLVHRLVLELFVGPCPAGMEARHLDDDGLNNRLDNLAWGTRSQNIHDRFINGAGNAGENHPNATLTDSLVLEIRRLFSQGVSPQEIALSTGVKRRSAQRVARGERWGHIPWEPGTSPTIRPSGRYIVAFGEKKRLHEWDIDSRCNVSQGSILRRIKLGMSPEDAITAPPLTPSQAGVMAHSQAARESS